MTLKTLVAYLDSIDAPTTDIFTINGILICSEIKDSQGLLLINRIFDEDIYGKVANMKCNNSEKLY